MARRYVDLVFGEEVAELSTHDRPSSGVGSDISTNTGNSILSVGYSRDGALVKLVESHNIGKNKTANRARPKFVEVNGAPWSPTNQELPPYTLEYDNTTSVNCTSTYKWEVETTAEDGTTSTAEIAIPIAGEFSAETTQYVDIDFFGAYNPAVSIYSALRLSKSAVSTKASLGKLIIPLAADAGGMFAAFLAVECVAVEDYMRQITGVGGRLFEYIASRPPTRASDIVLGTGATLQDAASAAAVAPPAILQQPRWSEISGGVVTINVSLLLVTGDVMDRVELGRDSVQAMDLGAVLVNAAEEYGISESTAFSYLPVSVQRKSHKNLPAIESRGGFIRIHAEHWALAPLYSGYTIQSGVYFGRRKVGENNKFPKAGFYAAPAPVVLGSEPDSIELEGLVRKRSR